jgi:hypothetical protein
MNAQRFHLVGAIAALALMLTGCPAGTTPVPPPDAPRGKVGFLVEGSSHTREVEVRGTNGEVVERRLMAPGEEVWLLLPAGEYTASVQVVPVERLPAGKDRPACPEGLGTPIPNSGPVWSFVVEQQGEVTADGRTAKVQEFGEKIVGGECSAYRCANSPTAASLATSTPAFWPASLPGPTPGPTAVRQAVPRDEAACLVLGGVWAKHSCMQRDEYASCQCWNIPASDAGQPCSASSECQGGCEANLTLEDTSELLANQPEGQPLLMTGTCSSVVWPNDVGEPSTVKDGQLNPGHWVGCE